MGFPVRNKLPGRKIGIYCLFLFHFLYPPKLNGTVRGLKARGGAEISETWKDGKLKQAIVKPMHDGVQKFIGKAPLKAETEEKEVFWEVLEDGYEIRMEKGKVYQLIF